MSCASLLIVIVQPLTQAQRKACLDRISEGLLCLDSADGEVDWNTELLNFLNKNVPPEETDEGGLLLRLEGKVYMEVLVDPTVRQLDSSLRSFVTSPQKYKHLIHAGPIVSETGDWFLRDAFWTVGDLQGIVNSSDSVQALKEICPGSKFYLSCISEGRWTQAGLKQMMQDAKMELIVNGSGGGSLGCVSDVSNYFSQFLDRRSRDLMEMMRRTKVVGNVTLKRPTVYVFPGGDGHSALIGIQGFNILLDGGYGPRPSYWDFVRHLDRVDALLISGMKAETVFSTSNFLQRLGQDPESHPRLGLVYANLPPVWESGQTPSSPLSLSVMEESGRLAESLKALHLKPQPLSFSLSPKKTPEVVSLYYKAGHGKLDMYPLNPAKDSKAVKDLQDHWKKGMTGGVFSPGKGVPVPLLDATSIAVMLVWIPARSEDGVKKILLSGSCPQQQLLAGLEKLRGLDFMKAPSTQKKLVVSKPGGVSKPPPKAAPHPVPAPSQVQQIQATSPPIPPRNVNVPLPIPTREIQVPSEPPPEHKSPKSPPACPDSTPVPVVPLDTEAIPDVPPPPAMAMAPSPELISSPEAVSVGPHVSSPAPDTTGPDAPLDRMSQHTAELPLEDVSNQHSLLEDFDVRPGMGGDDEGRKNGEMMMMSGSPVPVAPSHVEHAESGSLAPMEPEGGQPHILTPESPTGNLNDFRANNQEYSSVASPLDPGVADPFPNPQDFLNSSSKELEDVFGISAAQAGADTAKDSLVDITETFGDLDINKERVLDPFQGVAVGESSTYFTPNGATGTGRDPTPHQDGQPIPASNLFPLETDRQELEQPPPPTLEEVKKEWGQPLGLPPPSAASKAQPTTRQLETKARKGLSAAPGPKATSECPPRKLLEEVKKEWGQPLGLPPPSAPASKAKPSRQSDAKAKKPLSTASAPKAAAGMPSRKLPSSSTKPAAASSGPPTSGRGGSRVAGARAAPPPSRSTGMGRSGGAAGTKKPPPALTAPIEVDLVYVPSGGRGSGLDSDFFRLIRAKHFVLSSVQPKTDTLEALLAGKKAWNQPEKEVQLIPTYDSQNLHMWMRLKEEDLDGENITIAPSAARCQINMEQGEDGDVCAAYRLQL